MRKDNEIYCNKCGKRIGTEEDLARGEMLHVEKIWGYFSKKDGERHTFDLCEECYDAVIADFEIPVAVSEENVLI
ncbi:MAG: hypothetical protein UDG86_13850 [Lachnospiraceae bacterium]|jgi:hypothetical protein|nr:hypothetical protein [Lachnospiraceae bacterium]